MINIDELKTFSTAEGIKFSGRMLNNKLDPLVYIEYNSVWLKKKVYDRLRYYINREAEKPLKMKFLLDYY